ncbi:MAG: hypothetical protein N4A35_12715 [Flavobacteriales bacterium]|jgi:hypothetical protein|nr:hypothetical protein [Flavobacteriales bacterium]
MRYQLFLILGLMVLFNSCGSWSKQDRDNFIEHCQKTKLNDAYCDCALEKAVDKYSTFKEMTTSEEEMAELLFSCIEEDRKKEEEK